MALWPLFYWFQIVNTVFCFKLLEKHLNLAVEGREYSLDVQKCWQVFGRNWQDLITFGAVSAFIPPTLTKKLQVLSGSEFETNIHQSSERTSQTTGRTQATVEPRHVPCLGCYSDQGTQVVAANEDGQQYGRVKWVAFVGTGITVNAAQDKNQSDLGGLPFDFLVR